MEGIFDGQAVDSCFFCGLLYPADNDECPLCDRRMRYQPATVMSDVDLDAAVRARLADYAGAHQHDERRRCLLALLVFLHRYAPQSVLALAAMEGPDLDTLRRDYAALGPAP